MFKFLKVFDGFEEGQVVGNADLSAYTEREIKGLIKKGILEVVDNPEEKKNEELKTPETPEDVPPAPTPDPEVPAGDPNVQHQYKVLGVIPIMDGQGQKQGEYRIGSVYKFSEDIGNIYVAHGLAEKVEQENG